MNKQTAIANIATNSFNKNTFNFEWRIDNFDMVNRYTELIYEQVLRVATGETSDFPTEWEFSLYVSEEPMWGSYENGFKQMVGLRMLLKKPKKVEPIGVRANLIISKEHEDGTKSNFPRFGSQLESETTMLKNEWKVDLFPRDIPWYELPLVNGSLKINIELEIFSKKKTSIIPRIAVNSTGCGTFAEDFKSLQKEANDKFVDNLKTIMETESLFQDLKIISATGKEYFVSKRIFTAGSPVFAAMFNSQMRENRLGVLEMKDISDDMLELLVNYLQFGKLSEKMFSEPEVIIDVAYTAEKYELPHLHSFCDKMLSKNFDKLNLRGSLDISQKLRLGKTVEQVKKFIKDLDSKHPTTDN